MVLKLECAREALGTGLACGGAETHLRGAGSQVSEHCLDRGFQAWWPARAFKHMDVGALSE